MVFCWIIWVRTGKNWIGSLLITHLDTRSLRIRLTFKGLLQSPTLMGILVLFLFGELGSAPVITRDNNIPRMKKWFMIWRINEWVCFLRRSIRIWDAILTLRSSKSFLSVLSVHQCQSYQILQDETFFLICVKTGNDVNYFKINTDNSTFLLNCTISCDRQFQT